MDVVSKGQHRDIADGLRWNKLLSPDDADVLDYVYGWDIRAIMTSMRFDDKKFAKYYHLVIDYDHFGCIINERSLVRIYTITRDAEFALRLASMYHFPKEKDQNLIAILNRNQRID